MIKIAGCAGHGLNTSGKRTPDNEREWSFNNKVILAFEKELLTYEGVEFLRTDDRSGKVDIPLQTRTDKANKWGADFYISFHHNANTAKWGNWTGTQVHVYKTKPSGSDKFAKMLHADWAESYGLKDRGIIYNDLHITRETHCNSVLLEGGFMDSTIDIKALRDDSKLHNAGVLVARKVAEYYGLQKKKEEVKKPIPSDSKTLYKIQLGAFSKRENCEELKVRLEKLGYKPFIKQVGNLFKLQCGAFSVRSNAESLQKELQNKGFSSFLVIQK